MLCHPREALISDDYRAMQMQLHARPGGYGRSGAKHASELIECAEAAACTSILDYGCGDALLEQALRATGWVGAIESYDPCVPGRDTLPAPADVVACTDVLEHVEPEKLDAVLDDIRSLTRKHAYVVICTRPAGKFLMDGRNAHLIVRDATWWENALRKRSWLFHSCEANHKEVTFWLDVPSEQR